MHLASELKFCPVLLIKEGERGAKGEKEETDDDEITTTKNKSIKKNTLRYRSQFLYKLWSYMRYSCNCQMTANNLSEKIMNSELKQKKELYVCWMLKMPVLTSCRHEPKSSNSCLQDKFDSEQRISTGCHFSEIAALYVFIFPTLLLWHSCGCFIQTGFVSRLFHSQIPGNEN